MLSVGCSEGGGEGGNGGTAGTGGVGGDPFPGNCGPHGFGGCSSFLAPGLYENPPESQTGSPDEACFYLNSDCTELVATEECDIGDDDADAHFLEILWTDGTNEQGEVCTAGIAVTPDLVPEVPVDGSGFFIQLTDAEGAEWHIDGHFGAAADWGFVWASRSIGDSYCRSPDSPGVYVELRQ
jgi:hypothetical protein